jgi:hypothetical protein
MQVFYRGAVEAPFLFGDLGYGTTFEAFDRLVR